MQLGEVAWKIDCQPDERERLSALLSSDEHIARDIFRRYAMKTKNFQVMARSLQRRIKGGFRPGTDIYNDRASECMLSDLTANTASGGIWNIYRDTVALFVENEAPAINEMMRSVDLEVNETWTNEDLSHELLEAICSNAPEYDVHDVDVELLYELWPMPRQSDFRQLVAACPRLDRIKSVEATISRLRDEISSFHHNLTTEIEETVSRKIADVHIPESLKKTEERLKRDMVGAISKEAKRFNSEYSKVIKDLSETLVQDRAQFTKDIKELQKSQNHLNKLVRAQSEGAKELQSNIDNLAKNIKTFGESLGAGKEQQRSESFSAKARWPQDTQRKVSLGKSAEAQLVQTFIERCDLSRIEFPDDSLRALHCIFKSAPIVCCTEASLIDIWIDSLGWSEYAAKCVASPGWTSDREWSDSLNLLAEDSADPSVVYLLDYDAGLVEAYLNPSMRLWSEYDFANSSAKLYLVCSTPRLSDFALLKAPVIYVDQLVPAEINCEKRLPSVEPLAPDVGVTRQCFASWLLSSSQLRERIVGGAPQSSFDEVSHAMRECSAEPNKACSQILMQLCTSLDMHDISKASAISICLRTLILPWVESNHGMSKASELKAYVGIS